MIYKTTHRQTSWPTIWEEEANGGDFEVDGRCPTAVVAVVALRWVVAIIVGLVSSVLVPSHDLFGPQLLHGPGLVANI